MTKSAIRAAFVQPIVGPVREAWFRKLAGYPEVEFCVFSLSETLKHRPGWRTPQDAGFCVKQLRSLVIPTPRRFTGNRRSDFARRLVPIDLAWQLLRFRPDIVVATNATELLQALPVKSLFGTRLVLLAEDTQLTYSRIGRFRRWMKTFAYRLADAYAAHSSEARNLLLSLNIPEGRIGFTPWSVDIEKFSTVVEEPSQTNEKTSDRTLFVTIGALIPRKGIDRLLEAWAAVSKDLRAEATLAVLGTGPEYQHLKNFARDKELEEVVFAGHVDHTGVAQWLSRADVFVFPTLEDIWGFVASEAMAASLPLLCSKYAGCKSDLVQEGVNGWVFDPLDQEELTALLEASIRNKAKLPDMGSASRAIIEDFTIERSLGNLVEILRKVADNQREIAS